MPFLGELSALFTACLWSGSALVFTAATRRVGSFQVNISRLILGALYLLLTVAVFGLDTRLSPTQFLNLAISGLVGLTIGDTFLFKAFQEIGARVSMLIMSLAPAFAAMLAYVILGEGLTLLALAGMGITLSGIAIVVLERSPGRTDLTHLTAPGVLYALIGAIGQGAGLVFAKMAFREAELDSFVATTVRILASLVPLLPLAIITGRYGNPIRAFAADPAAFRLTVLGSLLGPFLGISFSLVATKYTDVGVAATIMAIVPILMLPLVRIIYREHLTPRAVAGAFVAVAGVAVLFLR